MAVRNNFIKFTDKESTDLKEFFDGISNIDVDLFDDDVIKFHINKPMNINISLAKIENIENNEKYIDWALVILDKNTFKRPTIMSIKFPGEVELFNWIKQFSNFIKFIKIKE